MLITNKLVTYSELKNDLDIDEMLDLYEICLVNLYNKNLAIENRR